MSRVKRLITILLPVFLLISYSVKAQNVQSAQEGFFEANRAYKKDQFQAAIDGYLKLIKNGFENGHIYFNLANAYLRAGDLGRAILFYERAYLLIPRDDDLNFNLSHAKSQTVDATDKLQTFAMNGFLGLDTWNLYEAFFVFSILNVFLFFILGIRLFNKAEWSYYLSIFLVIVISVGALVLALKWYQSASDNRAIILADEVAVRAGPDPQDTVLFKIHEGTMVNYERSEDGWVLLNLSEDKRGWVKSSQLERIVKKDTTS